MDAICQAHEVEVPGLVLHVRYPPLRRLHPRPVRYPDGTARRGPLRTWNAGHCCGDAMRRHVDDVGFIRALIDTIAAHHPVDRKRIYVTGISNGAMLAHRVGIALGDRVAAIAPVVGALFGDEPAPNGHVSLLAINGMRDTHVPYDAGLGAARVANAWDGTPNRPAIEQARYWARANGCTGEPRATDQRTVVVSRYTCPGSLAVELVGVKEGGHAWFGGRRGTPRADDPSTGFDATDASWAFFAAHPKP